MAAALTELLATMPDNGFAGYGEGQLSRAQAIIDIALAAGRPAWAAAARAIQGVGLVSMGHHEEGLEQLEIAETELAQEVTAGTVDPWGKPQGVAAGHNNLGYAYLLLQAYELALPHLTSALSISRWGYGPDLSVQAEMDVFNLGELHLRWAVINDYAGDAEAAAEQAESVMEVAAALSRKPSGDPAGPWADAAAVLRCGVASLAAPDSLDARDLALLQRSSQGEEMTFLHNLSSFLLARVARILGSPTIAGGAAERVAAQCARYDPMLAAAAVREAALAQAGRTGHLTETLAQYKREAQHIEQQRQRFAAQLQQRIAAALARQARPGTSQEWAPWDSNPQPTD